MLRMLITGFAVVAVAVAILPAPAQAADIDDIVGLWECLDTEEAVWLLLDCGEDWMFFLDIYDIEDGTYEIDKKNKLVGVRENYPDAEIEWVSYQVKGDYLKIFEDGDEGMVMEFERIWKPEKTKNKLVGLWQIFLDDEMIEMGVSADEFMLQFDNDGTALMFEKDEALLGEIDIDGNGAFEFIIEDDIATGEYDLEFDALTLWVDGDGYIFTRV